MGSPRRTLNGSSPLTHLDGWTEDSEDPEWMAEYRDFTGTLSDDSNSHWELVDDRSIRLSQDDGLERDRYLDFTEAKVGNPELVGTMRERYADSQWG